MSPAVPKPVSVKKVPKQRVKVAKESCPLEESEQIALCDWLRANNICFNASAMGSVNHVVTRIRLKRMGCAAGFPDITIFDSPPLGIGGCKGVAIELKRVVGGEVSDLQKDWQKKLQARGWEALICLGADSAIEALRGLGYGRRVSRVELIRARQDLEAQEAYNGAA